MNRYARPLLVAALCAVIAQAQAQNEKSLTRDEVALFKKKLVAVLQSLGQPPSGYSVERESFSLPTDVYLNEGSGKYQPLNASADREYGSEKSSEKASKDFEKEYEKKMMEAQAKGDYEEMARLAQDVQKKAGELSLKAHESKKEPINVHVALNQGGTETIDPDAVVHEQSGVIVLKSLDHGPERGMVTIYADPVSLKDTKQLSKVSMEFPRDGVAKRTAVLNATISFHGPAAEIEAWAKRLDFKKVLSQIDR